MSFKGLSNDEASAITLRNQKDSLLLRLPAELRNLIYGYVFDRIGIHFHYPGVRSWLVYEQESSRNLPVTAYALVNSTAACRQIRAEAEILFFENTELGFVDWYAMWKTLSKIEPRQRRAIKTLRIRIYRRLFKGDVYPLKHWDGLECVYLDSPNTSQQLFTALRTLFGKADLQFV